MTDVIKLISIIFLIGTPIPFILLGILISYTMGASILAAIIIVLLINLFLYVICLVGTLICLPLLDELE
ncbi:hypothetical protein FDJ58_gp083 [Bacillus phage SIOphi]|uniref:Uncharacterized protein n=1 Tax=Bacillus phage SIOphi TaxID=1285382 RepID=R4JGK5_9CAUD|nr:hypothetical protein FDJ58_gp083 [Bacillus phage SIOphi]AGK86891.1 hypothetical protein SIOphi_00415 [Bacillus phage SIOphi]